MAPQSTYTRAHRVICEVYVENNQRPLTIEQVTEGLECAVGLSFHPGTRVKDVVSKLSGWGLVVSGKFPGCDDERVVPLSQPKC
jgi:hypothetical protein